MYHFLNSDFSGGAAAPSAPLFPAAVTTACHFQWEQINRSGQNKQGCGQSQAPASESLLTRFSIYLHISVRERLLREVRVCNNSIRQQCNF